MPLYPLINVLIALVIVGVILWGVSQIPMDETIRKVIRVIVVVGGLDPSDSKLASKASVPWNSAEI